jgi:hypothetical protein
VREASLIGFVSNVYVPSVAEEYAVERGTSTRDIVTAFKEVNVPLTINAGDDLHLLVRELALLVSLQRLGCVSSAAIEPGHSLTERLRGARRLLQADYGPWLRGAPPSSSANSYLADAVADEIGSIVVPLRNALRLLLALPPASSSASGEAQFDSQFVDTSLVSAVRLHAERCELGGVRRHHHAGAARAGERAAHGAQVRDCVGRHRCAARSVRQLRSDGGCGE